MTLGQIFKAVWLRRGEPGARDKLLHWGHWMARNLRNFNS